MSQSTLSFAEAGWSKVSITCSDKSREVREVPTLPTFPHRKGPLLGAEQAFPGILTDGGSCLTGKPTDLEAIFGATSQLRSLGK